MYAYKIYIYIYKLEISLVIWTFSWKTEERKKDHVSVPLTCLCPKCLRMAASFLEPLWSLWIGTAGFGSLQSTESRWIHMLWSCRWARLMLGSKQWTSQPELANNRSRASSSAPSLHKHSPVTHRSTDSFYPPDHVAPSFTAVQTHSTPPIT